MLPVYWASIPNFRIIISKYLRLISVSSPGKSFPWHPCCRGHVFLWHHIYSLHYACRNTLTSVQSSNTYDTIDLFVEAMQRAFAPGTMSEYFQCLQGLARGLFLSKLHLIGPEDSDDPNLIHVHWWSNFVACCRVRHRSYRLRNRLRRLYDLWVRSHLRVFHNETTSLHAGTTTSMEVTQRLRLFPKRYTQVGQNFA